jgi:hypothetical protein
LAEVGVIGFEYERRLLIVAMTEVEVIGLEVVPSERCATTVWSPVCLHLCSVSWSTASWNRSARPGLQWIWSTRSPEERLVSSAGLRSEAAVRVAQPGELDPGNIGGLPLAQG